MTDTLTPNIIVPTEAYFVPDDRLTEGTKAVLDSDPASETYGKLQFQLAPWGRCILDGQTDCWTIAELKAADPELKFAHQGDTELADGTIIKTANLGGNAGHADSNMNASQARDFYGNTSLQVARVRYSWDDKLGLVGAGVVWPDVMDNEIAKAKIMASATSLDARYIQDEKAYRLVGACMVSVPGLPLRRASLTSIEIAEHHPIILAHISGNEIMAITADNRFTSDTSGFSKADAIIEKYNEEQKTLTAEVADKRKAINDKYRELNKQLTKTVKEADKRRDQRQALSDRKTAELTALREETKGKRAAIRARQAAESRALQDKQRSERDSLRDSQRSQRDELKNRTRSAGMNTLTLPGLDGDVFLPGDIYTDGREILETNLLGDGTWQLSFAEELPEVKPTETPEIEQAAADCTCGNGKTAAPGDPPAVDKPATDQLNNSPDPSSPLTWADVPKIVDMAVNAVQQMADAEATTAALESMLASLPRLADAMIYERMPKAGFEYNEIVTWSGGEALAGETMTDDQGQTLLRITPIVESRLDRGNEIVVPASSVKSTGTIAKYNWYESDEPAIVLPGESVAPAPTPAQNPPSDTSVPAPNA